METSMASKPGDADSAGTLVLSAEFRSLAQRYLRAVAAHMDDAAANSALTAMDEQGGRLYSEAGKRCYTDFFDLSPPLERWQPPFEDWNPHHRERERVAYEGAWFSVLRTESQRFPNQLPGGENVGGLVYQIDFMDAEERQSLGTFSRPPSHWRHWAEACATLCEMLARRCEAYEGTGKTPVKGKSASLPKTRRGLQRLAETMTKDQPIIAAIREGKSYRQVARECKVGKTTVGRVAQAYGLTGHTTETVPLEGTLQENLSVRGKLVKRGNR